MILLDTHVWIWWIDEDRRLTPAQRNAIEAEYLEGIVGISAVSCWEIAMLVSKAV